MSEELEVLHDVVRRLEGLGVSYMLTGSFAANIYAVPRMTRDIDLVIELDAAQVPRFAREFENDYYCDGSMVGEAVRERKMFNLIHNHALLKIDFIIRKDADYRKAEFDRRRPIEIEGRKVWVVSPEDLILSKLVWAKDSASEMQRKDVRNLIAGVASLEREYIKQWVDRLDVKEIYSQVTA